MEAEAETGGRRPPAQGWTPGAPRGWKRWGGPSPGASAGSPALGHPDLRRLVSRAGGGWIVWLLSPHIVGALGSSYNSQRGLRSCFIRDFGAWSVNNGLA